MEPTKKCGCKTCKDPIKPISAFSKDKHRPDGLNNKCRVCCKEQWSNFSERKYGSKPMEENPNCSQYLGIHIAERILSHIFKDVQRMPLHNHGYDFICGKGFKIDAKSSCAYTRTKNGKQWQFNIEKNKIADFFLCIAFDNRVDLNPLYLWLIPGSKINDLQTASIGERSLHKWDEWQRPIDSVLKCCNKLKSN